ncbi:MAG: hypothetical protein JF592_12205 [Microbacterium sp.]|uniref:hypothetical protein n=1 Tax=Microbacterium sp. TaxID=51671 RepID=UPI001DDBB502|nr:hypothetical protein [Microbacterium sp.]MBW8763331.1 hypothetical protein [Microbacterium sp.]
MIQLWSAIVVALLTIVLGPLLRGELSGKLIKRVAAHVELREKITDVPDALADLDHLLSTEIAVLREREEYRLTRKVNGANVAALIFVALLGGGGVYGLITAGIAVGGGWGITLYVLAVIYGLFFVALAAVGTRTVFSPPKENESTS